ncbi:MAG: DeoR/GlpR family DNA-binding transcription regulator [Anaerolineaceae bacterium]|jgi:DeoR/GlpR family transcriptional regulator of sugar metabolism
MVISNKVARRQQKILEYLSSHQLATPIEIAKVFSVSGETIRKDIETLHRAGLVHRIHGGVTLIKDNKVEKSHVRRSIENVEQKKAIAAAALEYIEPGDSIMLENGTTLNELADALRKRESLLRSILVVTMSFRIADVLRDCPGIKLLFLGGWLREGDYMSYGQFALDNLKQLNIDKAFISSAGLNESLMLTDFYDEEVFLRRQILENSREKVLLLDSSKMGQTKLVNVAHLSSVDMVISDVDCSEEMQHKIKEAGVKLHLT